MLHEVPKGVKKVLHVQKHSQSLNAPPPPPPCHLILFYMWKTLGAIGWTTQTKRWRVGEGLRREGDWEFKKIGGGRRGRTGGREGQVEMTRMIIIVDKPIKTYLNANYFMNICTPRKYKILPILMSFIKQTRPFWALRIKSLVVLF